MMLFSLKINKLEGSDNYVSGDLKRNRTLASYLIVKKNYTYQALAWNHCLIFAKT